ncbi:helix-turn-helix domain-containing protein [Alkalicoccus urumqiensis]|uniref:DNA-binding protein n=1 Tax=Alkalicoccus urumqiensis TaxID=1548213 RepID=A0A2P6MLK3_ALKUR|nr:helix-turn-helix domain-containing protein [Alkalicoccus urumqiensis]PRO67162.1 DNA-binding protein [Alkalicoccus urumqiensis]
MTALAIGIGLGLAAAGYFVGEGLRNFGKGSETMSFFSALDDAPPLMEENELAEFLGVNRKDIHALVQNRSDLPRMDVNGTVYFPRAQVREWAEHGGNLDD